jgi:hypothetical protein
MTENIYVDTPDGTKICIYFIAQEMCLKSDLRDLKIKIQIFL